MITMTYDIALAASRDKAEAAMRKAHRTRWNAADYEILCMEFHRLWPCPKDVACHYCLANLCLANDQEITKASLRDEFRRGAV